MKKVTSQKQVLKARELDPRMLEIMVCPVTKTTLEYDKENSELISKEAGLAYPIKNGVPFMLASEARKLVE